MCEQKFFKCEICGNLVGMLNNGKTPMVCCGEVMKELVANSVEAAHEKHIPKVEKRERLVHVEVGSILHPSLPEHHIEFIYLQTSNGGQRKCIEIGNEPKAMFMALEGEPLEVYAYCNLHGLWKTDIMCDCGCDKTMKDCDCDDNCDEQDALEKCECGCENDKDKCVDKRG